MQEDIFFYFTSDLHSYFDNWPKIISFLQKKFTERKKRSQDYFLLDNGDHLDRVNPMTEGLKGMGNIELLNAANYDIVNLGNNEGITLTKEELSQLYDTADFKVTCANLSSQTGDEPEWLKPYQIIKTASGVKVAVIGLTAPFSYFYQPLGWTIHDPIAILETYRQELKQQADIIILLSHLGIDSDKAIANQFPEIDVIIGGHTHHLFETGEVYEQSILTGVGKSGFHVGEICLTWDHAAKQLTEKQATAYPISAYSVDLETVELVTQQQVKAEEVLSKQVVNLKEVLEVDWYQETLLIKQLTETLKAWTDADVAMLNAGILLKSFQAGVVTELDIHRNCPHPINPCVVKVTGQELVEIVRAGLTDEFQQTVVNGYGFRGKLMGVLVYAGLTMQTIDDLAEQPFIESLTIEDKPIDLNKSYRLATADMFTFGHLSPQISRAQSKQFYMPEFIRDLLRFTLKKLNNS